MKKTIKVDSKIKKGINDILDLPIIIYVNEFTEASAKAFAVDFEKAYNTGQQVIPIVIDSNGGSVDALLHMVSEIKNCDVTVATICQGKAMSAGGILLGLGHEGYRYCDPNSRIMLHDVANFAFGKNEAVKIVSQEMDRLNKLIFNLISENCGYESDYFLNKLIAYKHQDWYLTPKMAKKLNLINHIKVPEFQINVRVDVDFC